MLLNNYLSIRVYIMRYATKIWAQDVHTMCYSTNIWAQDVHVMCYSIKKFAIRGLRNVIFNKNLSTRGRHNMLLNKTFIIRGPRNVLLNKKLPLFSLKLHSIFTLISIWFKRKWPFIKAKYSCTANKLPFKLLSLFSPKNVFERKMTLTSEYNLCRNR